MSFPNSEAPHMGLSDALVYNRHKATSVPARKQTVHYQPWNSSSAGGFQAGDTVKINISGSDSQFLNTKMSFLQVKVQAVGAAAELDFSAYSLFRNLAVYQGSNQLERIESWNALVTSMYTLQGNLSSCGSGDNILYGTGTEVISSTVAANSVGLSLSAGPTIGSRGFLVPVSPASATFCLPLVGSAIFGPNQRMLPLCKLNELRLELILEDFAGAFFTAGLGTGFIITDIRFVAEVVTLDAGVMSMIDEQMSSAGELKISADGWSNFQSSHTLGNLTNNILISARYSSVKTLMSTFRNSGNRAATKRWVSGRANPNFKSWSYVCGNVRYPYTEITDDIAAYAEAQRALHNLGSLDSSGICNRVNWADAGAGANQSTYLIATDTESQSHKSGQLAGCGINLTKQDCFLSYSMNASLVTYTIDTFVNFDVWLVIKDRMLYVQN